MRKRILFACTVFLAVVTISITWQSFTKWWGDYVWLYPLLLGGFWLIIKLSGVPELACWNGVHGASRNGERQVILRCQEGVYRQRDDNAYLNIVAGLLLPWLVILNVRTATAHNHNYWCWVYRDQVDDTGWARLRRIARQPD